MAAGGASINFNQPPEIYAAWLPESEWHLESVENLPGGGRFLEHLPKAARGRGRLDSHRRLQEELILPILHDIPS